MPVTTPVPAAPVAPRRRPATAGTILGGEAWVVPHDHGVYPWVSTAAPAITITDHRTTQA